jgi:hypothetical protein
VYKVKIEKNILNFVGDIRQIGGMKRYALLDGKSRGVEAIDFDNGCGLTFTVLADRCLDIDSLKFAGTPVAFISRTGVVAPEFYNDRGFEWLRSFSAGFLTTCGLSQVGNPCVFEDEPIGLHGLIANIPAESYNMSQKWKDGRFMMQVTGIVRQAKHQGENLTLERTISCALGENELRIDDVITNEGTQPEPLMILYHMNLGYPLIGPDSDIVIPAKTTKGLDESTDPGIVSYKEMPAPSADAQSNVFLHKLHENEDGQGEFLIIDNRDTPNIAVGFRFPMDVLHTLAQWKLPRSKDYVMGLEPCNNSLRGISYEKENGNLRYLEPDESVSVSIIVTFMDDAETIKTTKERLLSLIL